MTTWHLLTGEYPDRCAQDVSEDARSSGGVGDYTRELAVELARRGHSVHVWSPSIRANADGGGILLHGLPDRFGERSRTLLRGSWDTAAAIVLLQYVPNALGAGGMNVKFCRWLRESAERNDVRVMFHEPYFYFSWNPMGNLRAIVQRTMARLLVDASRVVYLSTETWRRYLPVPATSVVLPIPSTIPRFCDREATARFRSPLVPAAGGEVVGHFGTFGDHVGRELEAVAPLMLGARQSARLLCIGRGSDRFAAALRERHRPLANRIHHTGPLLPNEVAAALHACDVMLQPYPDGVTTRRTSVMAPLNNGIATISTAGALTEAVWRETGAVALAPARDARALARKAIELLDDADGRVALAAAGRRAYDAHFALERSVDALLASA